MKTQTIDYETYIKESKIDDFVEYLFSSKPEHIFEETKVINTSISGKNVRFPNKNILKEKLIEIKEDKDYFIKNRGELGGSLYVKINKNSVLLLKVRVSYHAPKNTFGKGEDEENTIGFLCIDALSKEDEEQVHKIRKEKYPENLRESGLKDKEDHKKIVEEFNKKRSAEYKYVDLGTAEYFEVIDTIKSFLTNYNFVLYENLKFEDFNVSYEMDYDD